MKKLLLCVLVIALCVLLYNLTPHPNPPQRRESQTQPIQKTIPVTIGGATYTVALADTESLRTQGLSGTQSVPHDGMLFVFDVPSRYSFWMKDMRYPIDIIWIDSDKRVIDITENISPDTFPNTVSPHEPAQYVLETKAFWTREHTLDVGDQIAFGK